MESWRVSFAEPQRLVEALYVRDVAGLHSQANDPVVPPLVPPVLASDGLVAIDQRVVVAEQWDRWWGGLLALGEEVERVRLPEPRNMRRELSAWPELQQLAAALSGEVAPWSGQRHWETAQLMRGPDGQARVERELITSVTRRRFLRRPRPFALRITQLPVAGVIGWRVTAEHVLVTRGLREDVGAYRDWLTPIIAELAWGAKAAA